MTDSWHNSLTSRGISFWAFTSFSGLQAKNSFSVSPTMRWANCSAYDDRIPQGPGVWGRTNLCRF